MKTNLNFPVIVIVFLISILVNFMSCGIIHSNIYSISNSQKNKIDKLSTKIDSLETIISVNTLKKDTIIINPQPVYIYSIKTKQNENY